MERSREEEEDLGDRLKTLVGLLSPPPTNLLHTHTLTNVCLCAESVQRAGSQWNRSGVLGDLHSPREPLGFQVNTVIGGRKLLLIGANHLCPGVQSSGET